MKRGFEEAGPMRSGNGARRKFLKVPQRAVPRGPSFWAGPALSKAGKEKKALDVAPATYVSDTTGTVTPLNLIQVGDDYTHRDGRRCTMKTLYITGIIKSVDGITNESLNRLIIVYDKQTNGALPAITDVLDTADSRSQLNLNNRSRFQVVVDKRYALGRGDTTATTAVAPSPGPRVIKIFKKLNLDTTFSATTAAIASIATGSLIMITIGDQAAGNGGLFSLSTRLRFIDP